MNVNFRTLFKCNVCISSQLNFSPCFVKRSTTTTLLLLQILTSFIRINEGIQIAISKLFDISGTIFISRATCE